MSELKEDLKTKHLQQQKAKMASKEFSCCLQNLYHQHRKLLHENIELSITNEKLKGIVDNSNSNQQGSVTTQSLLVEIDEISNNQIESAAKLCFNPQSSPILSKPKRRKILNKKSNAFNKDVDNNSHNKLELNFAEKPLKPTDYFSESPSLLQISKNNNAETKVSDKTNNLQQLDCETPSAFINNNKKDLDGILKNRSKNNDLQRSICEETYFTQAEMEYYDTDMTYFEGELVDDDETQFEIPPEK